MGQLDGRVAIVTGSNKGIGKQVAIKFAEEGAKVALVSIDFPHFPLQPVADYINANGGEAIAVACDQTKTEEIYAAVEKVYAHFGRIDILCNIGQAGMSSAYDGLDEFTDEKALTLYKGGPIAYVHFTKACSRYMIEQGYGRIVNTSSGSAYGTEKTTAYAMAKWSAVSLTRTTAWDLGKYGITVNTLIPTANTGNETTVNRSEEQEKALQEYIKTRFPVQRIGRPYEDIAPAYVFLASEGAGYVTGQILNVTGGYDMHT